LLGSAFAGGALAVTRESKRADEEIPPPLCMAKMLSCRQGRINGSSTRLKTQGPPNLPVQLKFSTTLGPEISTEKNCGFC